MPDGTGQKHRSLILLWVVWRRLSTAAPPGAAMELIYQSKPVAPEQPQSVSPWSNTVVGTRMKGW